MSETKYRIKDSSADFRDQVQLYAFRYNIGDHVYGGSIPAISWEDAQTKANAFGATIDGILIEEMVVGKVCSVCAGDVIINTEHPQPLADEWPDSF